MKSVLRGLLIVGLALALFGCLEATPQISTLTLNDGQSARFTAVSSNDSVTVAWTLDDVQVATGNEYTYVAHNSSSVQATHTLVATEQGANRDSVSWTINVLPGGGGTCYLDEDGDGYGDINKVVTTDPPANCVANSTDCNDSNVNIHPGAVETCNGVDDNCNGIVDGNTVAGDLCVQQEDPPLPPVSVNATEANTSSYDAAHLNITVTWADAAGPAATYYIVYRSPWDANGTYEQVSGQLAARSFVYSQNWEDDVASVFPQPAPQPDPYDDERLAFIADMISYRDIILPALMNFKAPAYFRVQACNGNGCSQLSASDYGTAELMHTQANSELANVFYTAWSSPFLIMLGDMPKGAGTLDWCGLDICGTGGGTGGGAVMGRLWESTYREDYCTGGCVYGLHSEFIWDNFSETSDAHPGAYAMMNGQLSGVTPSPFPDDPYNKSWFNNQFMLSGEFTFDLSSGVSASVQMFLEMNKDNMFQNQGWAVYNYKGRSYQFTLPINPQPTPVNGIYVAEPAEPIVPVDTTLPSNWSPSMLTDAWGINVPLYVDPIFPMYGCVRNADEATLPQMPECPGTSWDIDEE